MGEIFPVRGEPERMTQDVLPDTAIPARGPSSPWPNTERAMTGDPGDEPADVLETDEGPIPEHDCPPYQADNGLGSAIQDDPPFDYGGES